ncbi:MAG: hypothetical protein MZU95_08645 [Desulfomicrobium escambiense]|nr:hypothetical protein [Desulfomicrobium escambiense]
MQARVSESIWAFGPRRPGRLAVPGSQVGDGLRQGVRALAGGGLRYSARSMRRVLASRSSLNPAQALVREDRVIQHPAGEELRVGLDLHGVRHQGLTRRRTYQRSSWILYFLLSHDLPAPASAPFPPESSPREDSRLDVSTPFLIL